MKVKGLDILVVACCLGTIGLALFAMIYYNDHFVIGESWCYIILFLVLLLTCAFLFTAGAILKDTYDYYFGLPGIAVALPLILIGDGLIISGAVCTLLVSQLFWIMTAMGILALAVGILIFCWKKVLAYFFAIAFALGIGGVAVSITLFINDSTDIIAKDFVTHSAYMYYGNNWLYKKLDTPKISKKGLGVFGYYERTAQNITIPSEIEGEAVIAVGRCSFRNENYLKGVAIPKSIVVMFDNAFEYCTSLTGVYYGGTIDDWCSINFLNERANPLYYGGKLYVDNERVVDVNLSDSTTEIGAYAFYNCKDIKTVTISANATEIGEYAFYGCVGLTKINFGGTKAQWNEISKGESWNYLTGSYTVTCLDGNIIK